MPKSIFSFFSGVGLLDLGFEEAGYNIVLVNEYKEEFLNAYRFARRHANRMNPIYGYHQCSIDDFLSCASKALLLHNVQLERNAGNIVGFIGGPHVRIFLLPAGIEGGMVKMVCWPKAMWISLLHAFRTFLCLKM